ncbi:MAG TPA: hypothetical protein ENI87_10000 [bacterium]|nr:hypothetical protein [bacterium]
MATFLLDEIGYDVPGSRARAVELAWARFVTSVYGWRDQAAPEPLPAVGAVEVLDRFLVDGVRRSLGGDVPLEQLLFHELAHAVQNHLQRMTAHMRTWGSLSGWREPDHDRVADGFSGGVFASERPIVLIRLLLDLPRGASIYVPHRGACFVDRYARFDLREDFAECARWMAYDPGKLADAAPAKFLFLNALGWSGRLDTGRTGPLWIDLERLRRPSWRRRVVAGAMALLADGSDAPAPDPLTVAAILRAHAALLHADDLPPAFAPIEAARDLPPELRQRLSSEQFTFRIDGRPRQPAPAGIMARWDEELCTWIEHREFVEGLEVLLDPSADELRARYRDEVLAEAGADRRERAFDRLLPMMKGALPASEFQQLCRAEAEWHAVLGRRFTAKRYELLAGVCRRDQLAACSRFLREAEGADYAAVELASAIAVAHAQAGDRDAALAAARAIPGSSWGAFRRVEQLLANGAREAALRCAASVELPRLRGYLRRRVLGSGR